VGVGEGVAPFVGLRAGPFVRLRAGVGDGRVGVEVGGTGIAVGSMVTARTTGSEGELLACTACISNWVFKSI
jgi:hypothetical protein